MQSCFENEFILLTISGFFNMNILKNYRVAFIVYCTVSVFTGCADSTYSKVDNEINKAIRSKNNVDEEEWKKIAGLVAADSRHYPELIESNGKVDNTKLTKYIIDYANGHRRNNAAPEIYTPSATGTAEQKPRFNIYVENSLSMDGYVKGNTSFEAAITKLLVLAKNYSGQANLHINFINSKIYPSKEIDISNFAQKLEPGSLVYNVGGKDRGISDLNKVYKTILDSTDKGTISVLISDCIYSLGKGGDTEGRLNIQKSLTMDAFLTRLKSADISTICLKMTSEFNGKYWDFQDRPVELTNFRRPYYIWFMGSAKEMEEFYSYLRSSPLEFYSNSFVMTYTKEGSIPYYSILKETNRVGRFNSDRTNREFVHKIEDISFDKGLFQFTLTADLSKLPSDSSYLLDKNNYRLTDGFTVQKIEKIDRNKIAPRDWVTIEQSTATHVFTIALKNNSSVRDLTIELKKQLPGWIAATNCMDDSDIKQTAGQTFGLQKLAEGIYDAYITFNQKQGIFFSIIVNLKK